MPAEYVKLLMESTTKAVNMINASTAIAHIKMMKERAEGMAGPLCARELPSLARNAYKRAMPALLSIA